MANVEKTAAFITTHRDHLLDLARRLASAIDPAFMNDPQEPVIIYVDGTGRGGKSIFPDMAAETYFGENYPFEGSAGGCERRTGIYEGRTVQLDFMNGARLSPRDELMGFGMSLGMFDMPYVSLYHLIDTRKHGGVVFIHNNHAYQREPDISIRLEVENERVFIGPEAAHRQVPLKSDSAPETLQRAFHERAGGPDSQWVRYVEMTVHNPDLLASPRFQQNLGPLFVPVNSAHSTAPLIYGENVPMSF